jgi:hypothetical protein
VGDAVRAKKSMVFILGNSLLHRIVNEVTDDKLLIGIAKDESVVRFKSNDMDFYHPTLDKKKLTTAAVVKKVTKGKKSKCTCRFKISQTELKKGVEAVLPIGRKASDATMTFFIKNGTIQLRLRTADNSAVHKLKIDGLKAKGDRQITVRGQYLYEFAKAAPSTVPLTVESWNDQYLRILVKEDQSMIDYMALTIADD